MGHFLERRGIKPASRGSNFRVTRLLDAISKLHILQLYVKCLRIGGGVLRTPTGGRRV